MPAVLQIKDWGETPCRASGGGQTEGKEGVLIVSVLVDGVAWALVKWNGDTAMPYLMPLGDLQVVKPRWVKASQKQES